MFDRSRMAYAPAEVAELLGVSDDLIRALVRSGDLPITLTDRPPVRIHKPDWPIVAEGDDDNGPVDQGRRDQLRADGQLTSWRLVVRQHADGRAIVYGVREESVLSRRPDWRGGEIVPAGGDIIAAIRRVGRDGEIPEHVIRECIADLPAEELV